MRLSDDERCHFVVPLVQHQSYPPVLTDTFKDYHFRCSAFELNFRILKANSTERWRSSEEKCFILAHIEKTNVFCKAKEPEEPLMRERPLNLRVYVWSPSLHRLHPRTGTHRATPLASKCQLIERRIDSQFIY